uniref:Cytochrome c oxidase subunit 3 n=1 Tax=Trichopria drosophilae TaxID=1507179 RepID=A0A6M3HRM6_9HYME|nr:cytochrome c oxidase subunit III [Trichopria drosophilae]QIV21184.1 cytochrome c oxidase subunit III [Trichopria drosophilae]
MKNHPYHLVTYSPWPLMMSFSIFLMILSIINMFKFFSFNLILLFFFMTLMFFIQWIRDIYRESIFQGNHTIKVLKGLKLGMMLFIISEIFFFISFFWSFFHSYLCPNIEIGMMWPPKGMNIFNPMMLPLLNSIILLSSGMMLTYSHFLLINNNKMMIFYLLITILLGFFFFIIQYYEYNESSFSICDSIYGSTFYMMTGFHGFHVIIGIFMLMNSFYMMNKKYISNFHHFSFELSAWYWHFVDVVWLFLFMMIYYLPY